jgi:hypothetical protein
MATRPNLPAALLAQINQAQAIIPSAHHKMPEHDSIISDPAAAYLYINDWAFLHGYAYMCTTASIKKARYRYSCEFYSRKKRETTQDGYKIPEKELKRINTHTKSMSCPVAISIHQYIFQEIYKAILTVSRLKDYKGQ